MRTLDDIFAAFGGPSKVGQIISVSTEHAAGMKRRGSIPVDYWPALIAAARERRIYGVTYEALTLMHANRTAQQRVAS
jgi:hypothetical protein